MESNANTDVDKLITFGQMALEQGWYSKAREYFEQALAVDASNREAMKGLARANEILSRSMPTPVEPIRVPPVAPARKVERKPIIPAKKYEVQVGSPIPWFRRQSRLGKMIVLMGVQVFLLCLYVSLTTFIHPTPKATPTPTSLDMPIPAGSGEEAFAEITEQVGTIIDAVKIVITEGAEKLTPTPTVLPQSTAVSKIEGGWLCDWDGHGEVALWSKPALAFQEGNSIVAVVEMPVKGCVDGILLDETTSGGIVFYQVRVSGGQGWVDVDHFYPISIGKPHWSR
jgi:hypothetical protein